MQGSVDFYSSSMSHGQRNPVIPAAAIDRSALGEIGQGSFTKVLHATLKKAGVRKNEQRQEVAIKQLTVVVDTAFAAEFVDEMRNLIQMTHANVGSFLGMITVANGSGSNLALVQEYYPLQLQKV